MLINELITVMFLKQTRQIVNANGAIYILGIYYLPDLFPLDP